MPSSRRARRRSVAARTIVINGACAACRWKKRDEPVVEEVEKASQRRIAAGTEPLAHVLGDSATASVLAAEQPKKRTPSRGRIACRREALQRRRREIEVRILAQANDSCAGRNAAPRRGSSGRRGLQSAQHGEEIVLARRLAQCAKERGQRGVAIGGAARRASVGRRLAEAGRLTASPACRCAAASASTVPRCGVFSVSWVKLLIAAWRAKKRSRTPANRNALVPWKASSSSSRTISTPRAERERPLERQPPDDASHLEAVHALDLAAPSRCLRAARTSRASFATPRRACCGVSPTRARWLSDRWLTKLQPSCPTGRRVTGRVGPRSRSTRPTGAGRFEPPRRCALVGRRDRQQGRQVAVRRPRA